MKNLSRQTKKVLLLALASTTATFLLAWMGLSIFENRYSSSMFEMWNQWDAKMYLRIAQVGYPNSDEGRFLISVLPLYPWLVRLTSIVFSDTLISSLLVSNFSLAIALIFFYKLVKLDFSEKIAWRSIFYFLIFPTAYFLHSGYSESLYLMFVFIATYMARKKRWFLAASIGMFGVMTRINGIILLPFLLAEYMTANKFKIHKVNTDILWLLLLPLGFLYYIYLNYHIFGNPFQFLDSLKVYFWEVPSFPWQGLLRAASRFSILQPADWMIEGGMVILFWVFSLCILIVSLKKIRFSYNVFIWLNFLFVSFSTTWSSLPRILLTLFPIFVFLAIWGRKHVVNFLITFIFLALQTIFLILFVRGHWAF